MSTSGGRPRNRRGDGALLREEIVRGAGRLLEETGSEDAVTLRAIARTVGIAAPSIYAHFPDRESVLLAVVQDAFADLGRAMTMVDEADPVARLRAVCAAYLDFALTRPARYRVLFGGAWSAARAQETPTVAADAATVGFDVFDVLVRAVRDCADAGRSTGTDPFADATALWAGLHGLAALRPVTPMFPWPDGVLDRLVDRLVLLT
ncbi:TetR/AcrR family transcriptional regulator [Saccharothrix lopnurensis]|uniref:TetR/AcrR family transcriptional regulator n=1 Tax=Saccharothrix lopnurensis TaxID=1670621 RepID=A0ABW1P2K6_9PSEU